MPYLQLDVPERYPIAAKRRLARRMGVAFATIMQTTQDRVRVGIREMTGGNLWLCTPGEPRPCAILSCDIRRGRTREQRAELMRTFAAICVEVLGLECDLLVELTQHPGEDFFRPGKGLAPEWQPSEAEGAASRAPADKRAPRPVRARNRDRTRPARGPASVESSVEGD